MVKLKQEAIEELNAVLDEVNQNLSQANINTIVLENLGIRGLQGKDVLQEKLTPNVIDHTLLKPDALPADIMKLCSEAEKYKFATVCVNPVFAELASVRLKGTGVGVTCVVGFPLGATTSKAKALEAVCAVEGGASEIDMVLNIGLLKNKNYDLVYKDIRGVVESSKRLNANITIKVIIETCLLSNKDKQAACLLVEHAGADFVKTSTGFSTGGASVEDVSLMYGVTSENVKIKASGGIRDQRTANSMLAAGASRLGVSASLAIIQENVEESTTQY